MERFAENYKIISSLFAVAGIVFYFLGFVWITILCALISISDSIIQVVWGEQNSFATEILAAFIGVVVSIFAHVPLFGVVALAICIESTALLLIGFLFTIPTLIARIVRRL